MPKSDEYMLLNPVNLPKSLICIHKDGSFLDKNRAYKMMEGSKFCQKLRSSLRLSMKPVFVRVHWVTNEPSKLPTSNMVGLQTVFPLAKKGDAETG